MNISGFDRRAYCSSSNPGSSAVLSSLAAATVDSESECLSALTENDDASMVFTLKFSKKKGCTTSFKTTRVIDMVSEQEFVTTLNDFAAQTYKMYGTTEHVNEQTKPTANGLSSLVPSKNDSRLVSTRPSYHSNRHDSDDDSIVDGRAEVETKKNKDGVVQRDGSNGDGSYASDPDDYHHLQKPYENPTLRLISTLFCGDKDQEWLENLSCADYNCGNTRSDDIQSDTNVTMGSEIVKTGKIEPDSAVEVNTPTSMVLYNEPLAIPYTEETFKKLCVSGERPFHFIAIRSIEALARDITIPVSIDQPGSLGMVIEDNADGVVSVVNVSPSAMEACRGLRPGDILARSADAESKSIVTTLANSAVDEITDAQLEPDTSSNSSSHYDNGTKSVAPVSEKPETSPVPHTSQEAPPNLNSSPPVNEDNTSTKGKPPKQVDLTFLANDLPKTLSVAYKALSENTFGESSKDVPLIEPITPPTICDNSCSDDATPVMQNLSATLSEVGYFESDGNSSDDNSSVITPEVIAKPTSRVVKSRVLYGTSDFNPPKIEEDYDFKATTPNADGMLLLLKSLGFERLVDDLVTDAVEGVDILDAAVVVIDHILDDVAANDHDGPHAGTPDAGGIEPAILLVPESASLILPAASTAEELLEDVVARIGKIMDTVVIEEKGGALSHELTQACREGCKRAIKQMNEEESAYLTSYTAMTGTTALTAVSELLLSAIVNKKASRKYCFNRAMDTNDTIAATVRDGDGGMGVVAARYLVKAKKNRERAERMEAMMNALTAERNNRLSRNGTPHAKGKLQQKRSTGNRRLSDQAKVKDDASSSASRASGRYSASVTKGIKKSRTHRRKQ